MVQRLKRIDRLSMLGDEVLRDLALVVTAERHALGTVICQEGALEDKFYAIESGRVRAQVRIDDQEVVLASFTQGDVFGERALAEALPRTATIISDTIVDLLCLHRRDYQRLAQRHPSLERLLVGPEVVSLLAQVPLFSRLSGEDLAELSKYVGVRYYPPGRQVVQQGDMGVTMYVVIGGDLVAYRMEETGRRRPVRAFKKGDSFGETSLLVGEPRDVTVIARTHAELLYLNRASFNAFLEAHPRVRDRLRVRPDVERKWKAKPFPEQNPDEIIEIIDNRHWIAFLLVLIRPLFWLTLFGIVLPALSTFWPSLFGGQVRPAELPVILAIFWGVVAGPVFFWYWVDWQNDYYIVTTQRVVHIERELLRATTTDVVPIEQVQNVEVRRGPWGTLFGYGHVRIATAAAAGRVMELSFVRESEAFQQAIFHQIARARFRAVEAERTELRQIIRQAIGTTMLEDVIEEEQPSAGEGVGWLASLGQSRLAQRLRQIITESGFVVFLRRPHFPREEIRTAEQVIWRKHWGILLVKTYRPLLLCLGFTVLTGLAVAGWLGKYDPLGFGSSLLGWVSLGLGLLLFFALFWLFWEVEDWRNDQYIVTNTHIIDIERTPFLLNESKRQARLESIENTQSSSQGLWRNLLRLGDVTIETAGEGTFTFLRVRNPGKVQAEIERRREAYRERVRQEGAERRRGEIVSWLSVYSDVMREESLEAEWRARQQSLGTGSEESPDLEG